MAGDEESSRGADGDKENSNPNSKGKSRNRKKTRKGQTDVKEYPKFKGGYADMNGLYIAFGKCR